MQTPPLPDTSTSGRYASYWNAYLLNVYVELSIKSSLILEQKRIFSLIFVAHQFISTNLFNIWNNRSNGMGTLHRNETGTGTGDKTGTTGNNKFLSLSRTSVSISTLYYTFHWVLASVLVPCSVTNGSFTLHRTGNREMGMHPIGPRSLCSVYS